ncbi:MAG: pilus assembly protein N-terminal domain-containing protein, partial [Cyanobacteria bacterium]|nr:pilus assembly protein N-terminal domain-containing protein [Cyanobacteriota bacterium]
VSIGCSTALAQSSEQEPKGASDATPARVTRVMPQAGPGQDFVASPIPPAMTGTLDLEEIRTDNSLELGVARSRTFKLKNKIVRTSIGDPGVAEPIVVAENQVVLLGKAPGTTTLILWDNAGNASSLDLHVSNDYSSLNSTSKEIDPRAINKPISSNGSDRLIQMGTVDNTESVIRSFSAGNTVMDDRGMNIQNSNNRLPDKPVGERSGSSAK